MEELKNIHLSTPAQYYSSSQLQRYTVNVVIFAVHFREFRGKLISANSKTRKNICDILYAHLYR